MDGKMATAVGTRWAAAEATTAAAAATETEAVPVRELQTEHCTRTLEMPQAHVCEDSGGNL